MNQHIDKGLQSYASCKKGPTMIKNAFGVLWLFLLPWSKFVAQFSGSEEAFHN